MTNHHTFEICLRALRARDARGSSVVVRRHGEEGVISILIVSAAGVADPRKLNHVTLKAKPGQ